jgi:uncharacterized RDD family membrane protein YckC
MDLTYIIRRGLTYLVDSLLMFGFFALTQRAIFLPLRRKIFGSDEWFVSGIKSVLYTLLTISFPIWLYFMLAEVSGWQATIGKVLLGFRTIDAVSKGQIVFWQSLLRTIIKMLPWETAHLAINFPVPMRYDPEPGFRIGLVLSPVLLALYLILVILTPNHQSLHDLIARTLVVLRE